MLRNSKTEIPYEDIDYEIKDLIRLINKIDGIETIESCCGHSVRPCCIWLKADNMECVTRLWHKCLYCNPNWRISLSLTDIDIDNGEWNNPTYLLETTFSDYQYTGLAIDNLTYKIRNLIKSEDDKMDGGKTDE